MKHNGLDWKKRLDTKQVMLIREVLLTCEFTDSVGLAVVLAHVGVNKIHNIRANWSSEYRRHDNIFASGFSFLGINRD